MTRDDVFEKAFDAGLSASTFGDDPRPAFIKAFIETLNESGWTLARIEPTEAMFNAGCLYQSPQNIYRAMIAAQDDAP